MCYESAFRQTVSSLMLSSVNEMGTAKTSRSDSLRFYLLTVTLLKQQQLHGHSAPLKYIGPLLGRSIWAIKLAVEIRSQNFCNLKTPGLVTRQSDGGGWPILRYGSCDIDT